MRISIIKNPNLTKEDWENKRTRVIEYYATLPVIIDGEMRWLERVKIKQQVYRLLSGEDKYTWENIKFVK